MGLYYVQRFYNIRRILGGSYQINIVSALILEPEKNIPQLTDCQGNSKMPAADGMILTKAAPESAAGEKYRAAAAGV